MNTNQEERVLLERSLALIEKSREELSTELARRARAIEGGKTNGRSWNETRREILGRIR